jgi:hypothetical protein
MASKEILMSDELESLLKSKRGIIIRFLFSYNVLFSLDFQREIENKRKTKPAYQIEEENRMFKATTRTSPKTN